MKPHCLAEIIPEHFFFLSYILPTASLRKGSIFGEISLLAVAGGNRRTADVRSSGYSDLFILSKHDLDETLRDFPEMRKLLTKRAVEILNKTGQRQTKEERVQDRERKAVIFKNPQVLQVYADYWLDIDIGTYVDKQNKFVGTTMRLFNAIFFSIIFSFYG